MTRRSTLFKRAPQDDELLHDLDDDFLDNTSFRARFEALESKVNYLDAEHIRRKVAHTVGADTRPTELDDVSRGEQILAKAQQALHHAVTPEGIMERAMRVFSDPSQIGIVQGFLAVGNPETIAKAASLVGEAEQRVERTNAQASLDQVTKDYGLDDASLDRQDEVAQLRQLVSTLEGRLVAVESNMTNLQKAAAAPQGMVAKGYNWTAAPQQRGAASPTSAELISRGHAVIDSPNTIGVLSGLLEQGKLVEAQAMVEAAEREHEAMVKSAERKRLR